MDYNASNSYGPGDAVSASVANMSIHDQRHQENGVQMGHRGPGDAKMKEGEAALGGNDGRPVSDLSGAESSHEDELIPAEASAEKGGVRAESPQVERASAEEEGPLAGGAASTAPAKMDNGSADKAAKAPPAGAKARAPAQTGEHSGQSSPGTPKSPSSQTPTGKAGAEVNKVKKVAVVRSSPKSPGSLKNPRAPLGRGGTHAGPEEHPVKDRVHREHKAPAWRWKGPDPGQEGGLFQHPGSLWL
ncbi:hypothetical protein fugu_000381 [Takifugu bimaculatus]|uniref:Uncharacterized protein n=1 Tax=Takifugu bimaculatus TaxID=433685 RepID=A0A4Z2CGJ4_9TELE|nr:hypothetical protein fugu_000381 [Takifugu bimaculatus]